MYGEKGNRGIRWKTYPDAVDRVQRIFTNEKKLLAPDIRVCVLGVQYTFFGVFHRGSACQRVGLAPMKEDQVDQEH